MSNPELMMSRSEAWKLLFRLLDELQTEEDEIIIGTPGVIIRVGTPSMLIRYVADDDHEV